jgi:hypothetical protein
MLEAALDALLATDMALKESHLSSDEQLLSNLVLKLCTAPQLQRGLIEGSQSAQHAGLSPTAEHA